MLMATLAITVVAETENGNSVIEAKIEKLEAIMQKQQHILDNQKTIIQEQNTRIHVLQQRITDVENEHSNIVPVFDCYRTEVLSTDGIITFNNCSIDTTTIDPRRGNFTIEESGIYRFTFDGPVGMMSNYDDPYGFVGLYVDDEAVASGFVEENHDGVGSERKFMLSIDTIQTLRVGQTVSLRWEGSDPVYLFSNINAYVHFTGHKLAPFTVALPKCSYTGQTFEFPGSCRKYYLCLADGSVELEDCCPDVFDPIREICVSEEDGGDLCSDNDTC